MFAILLLAAGQGRRFQAAGGQTFKLLTKLDQSTSMLRKSCETLTVAKWPIHVVTGSFEKEIRQELAGLDANFISNPDAAQGLSSSIARGVAATADADGWLVALADMPFIQPETILRVADALASGAGIVFPTCRGERGHPVGFSRRFYAELTALNGDSGARQILAAHRADWVPVEVGDEGILRDIDLPSDLASNSSSAASKAHASD